MVGKITMHDLFVHTRMDNEEFWVWYEGVRDMSDASLHALSTMLREEMSIKAHEYRVMVAA